MTTLNLDTLLIRSADLIDTDMDGDTVMMSIDRGEYFGISGVGPRVWQLLAQPMTVTHIARTICAEYDVDAATCQADLRQFAEALFQNGLVLLA